MKLDAQVLQEIRAFEEKNGVDFSAVTLQESLPTDFGKVPAKDDMAFLRLGLTKSTYANVAKPVTISEAPKDAKVVIPDGAHRKLAEALDGALSEIAESIHAKLARAL